MPTHYKNTLRTHTLSITESVEQSEHLAKRYENYFTGLGKYEQMEASMVIESQGWGSALEALQAA